MSNSNNSGRGVLIGLLAILFIGLKLTGYISWSWWWLLSPFAVVAVLVIILTFAPDPWSD